MKYEFSFETYCVLVTIIVADLRSPENNRFDVKLWLDGTEIRHDVLVEHPTLLDRIESEVERRLPEIVHLHEQESFYERDICTRKPEREKQSEYRYNLTHDERQDGEIGFSLASQGIYV